MSNYSIENHRLELNAAMTVLTVYDESHAVVDSFNLSTAHRLQCESGDYVIECTTMPSGFIQNYDPAEDDSLSFTDTEGLGISDLRTVRSQFAYHLDECPMVMQFTDGELLVHSPCGDPCALPLEDCCTITEPS